MRGLTVEQLFSNMLHLRSTRDEIVDAAMACFARDGFGVALRPIAEEAGISAALIVHHFGSKAGLRNAVDDHVLGVVEEKLRVRQAEDAAAAAMVLPLDEQGDLPRYLTRVLAEGGAPAQRLFESFVAVTEKAIGNLGLDDATMTAALLATHSLGAMLLADAVNAAVGVDLLGHDAARWANAAIGIYRGAVAPLLHA